MMKPSRCGLAAVGAGLCACPGNDGALPLRDTQVVARKLVSVARALLIEAGLAL